MIQRKKMFKKYGFTLFRNVLTKSEKNRLIDNIKLIEDAQNNTYKYGYDMDINGKYVVTSIKDFYKSNKFLDEFIKKGKLYTITKNINKNDIKLFDTELQYNLKNVLPYNSIISDSKINNRYNKVKCFVNLDDNYSTNSCIEVLPTLKDNKRNLLDLQWTKCPTIYGDIIILNSYTPYRYTHNNSNNIHKILKITYYEDIIN